MYIQSGRCVGEGIPWYERNRYLGSGLICPYSLMWWAHAGVTWSPHRPIKFGLFLSRAFICWPQEKKDGLAKIEEYFCQSADDPLVLLRTHPSYPLKFLRHASSPYIGRTYSTSKKLDQTCVFQHYYSFAQLNTPRTITSSDGIIKAYGLSLSVLEKFCIELIL